MVASFNYCESICGQTWKTHLWNLKFIYLSIVFSATVQWPNSTFSSCSRSNKWYPKRLGGGGGGMPNEYYDGAGPPAFSMGQVLPPWPSSIGLKFGCTFYPQNWQIWSDLGCNSGVTFTGSRFRFVFDTSSTPSTAWLAVHRSTWSSYATPWLTFQQGETFDRRPWFSSPSISEGTIREKRFLRLLTTAVELTSCRHPTSPQRASTFPKETQNSLYATVHVMPLRIDVSSVNSTILYYYTTTLNAWCTKLNAGVWTWFSLQYWQPVNTWFQIHNHPSSSVDLWNGTNVQAGKCGDVRASTELQ